MKAAIAGDPYLSDEWVRHRGVYVGASQLAAIIGVSSYTSLAAIFNQKHHGIFEETSAFGKKMQEHGRITEPEAHETFVAHRNNSETTFYVRSLPTRISDYCSLLGASIDAAGYSTESRAFIEGVEYKCPGMKQPFKEVSEIPIDNVLQCAANCHVYKVPFWTLFYYWADDCYVEFKVSGNEEFFGANIIPAIEQFCSGFVDVEINRRRRGRKASIVAALRKAFPVTVVASVGV